MATINLQPKIEELKEMSILFNEGQRLYGFKADIYIPEEYSITSGVYEKTYKYNLENKITCYITIENNTKIEILQDLGWYVEDSKSQPLICYIAKHIQPIDEDRNPLNEDSVKIIDIVPKESTIILLDYAYQDIGRQFKVKKVSQSAYNPIYYICEIEAYSQSIIDNNQADSEVSKDIKDIIKEQEETKDLQTKNDDTKRQETKDIEKSSDNEGIGTGRRFINY